MHYLVHINVQYSLDTIMSDQRDKVPVKVKSLAELCTYVLATQWLLGNRELKSATLNAKRAVERDANHPIRCEFLENKITAMKQELKKLEQELFDLHQARVTAPREIVLAVKERDELYLSVKFLATTPGVLAEAEAICKVADKKHQQNLDARQAAKENLNIKVSEFKAFQTENSKRRDYPKNFAAILAAIRNQTEVSAETENYKRRDYPKNLAAIRENTKVSAEDKLQLIRQFEATVVNSELEVEKPLACDDVDDVVWLENTELYYRNIVAALKDCKNKANEHLEKCIIIVNKGVPFSKFGSS
jgi:cell division septum initiation protein DivIVA